jgi:hypothetical protein
MANNLITKSEYKTYAGITSPNSDAEIDLLIPKVSQLVKTYCRNTFVDFIDDPKVQHFNGGYEKLLLKESPIISVSSVEQSSDYGQTYTEHTSWVLDLEDNTVTSIDGVFPKLLNGYRVTYYAGYESVPEDLKLAVMDLVTYYRRNDGSVHSNKAPGTNSVQVEYISTTTLPAHIRRVLDMYVSDYT